MLRPLKSKIVVKPISRIKSSVIEVVMDERDNQGTVVSVGPDAARYIQPGAFIRFGTMGRTSADEYLKYHEWRDEDGERYLVMDWADVCFEEDQRDAA